MEQTKNDYKKITLILIDFYLKLYLGLLLIHFFIKLAFNII